MQEIEKIAALVNELKELVSKIDFETKNKLAQENKDLKEILFEQPKHFLTFYDELGFFEKKFNYFLPEKLKEAYKIANYRGFEYSFMFEYSEGSCFHPIQAFLSEDFIKILIKKGLSEQEIEDSYYSTEYKGFNSKKITEIYNSLKEKENLLIYYIPFHESCGGRALLILNGKDQYRIAYDNHNSYEEILNNGKIFSYQTYLFSTINETIFDLIIEEISKVIEKLKQYN